MREETREMMDDLGIVPDLVNEMLQKLSEAPDSQLDATMCVHLKNLIGKPKAEVKRGVIYAIDMCVYSALSSGFVLKILHMIHQDMLGGTREDFNDENCPWRKSDDKSFR